jgi:hypothetical protein
MTAHFAQNPGAPAEWIVRHGKSYSIHLSARYACRERACSWHANSMSSCEPRDGERNGAWVDLEHVRTKITRTAAQHAGHQPDQGHQTTTRPINRKCRRQCGPLDVLYARRGRTTLIAGKPAAHARSFTANRPDRFEIQYSSIFRDSKKLLRKS